MREAGEAAHVIGDTGKVWPQQNGTRPLRETEDGAELKNHIQWGVIEDYVVSPQVRELCGVEGSEANWKKARAESCRGTIINDRQKAKVATMKEKRLNHTRKSARSVKDGRGYWLKSIENLRALSTTTSVARCLTARAGPRRFGSFRKTWNQDQ